MIPRSRAHVAALSSSRPMTLWLLAVTPTRFPAATRSTMSSAPRVVLPDPGRPLDGQDSRRAGRARAGAPRHDPIHRPATRAWPGCLPETGRVATKKAARGVIRAVGRDPVLGDPASDTQEALAMGEAAGERVRHQRGRPQGGGLRTLLEVHEPLRVVDLHDGSRVDAERGALRIGHPHLRAHVDVVFLGRERIPMDHRPRHRPDLAHVDEPAERVRGGDTLFFGALAQQVHEAPPAGLLFTTVPVEQLAEQP